MFSKDKPGGLRKRFQRVFSRNLLESWAHRPLLAKQSAAVCLVNEAAVLSGYGTVLHEPGQVFGLNDTYVEGIGSGEDDVQLGGAEALKKDVGQRSHQIPGVKQGAFDAT
jgi:hypothetical protein